MSMGLLSLIRMNRERTEHAGSYKVPGVFGTLVVEPISPTSDIWSS